MALFPDRTNILIQKHSHPTMAPPWLWFPVTNLLDIGLGKVGGT